MQPDDFRELGREVVHRGRFLNQCVIRYQGPDGKERLWDAAARVRDTGAVLAIPTLVPSNRLLFVRQYRPPAGRLVMEFPAGLVEPGEDPAEAAVREVREETGYTGRVDALFPPQYTSPGLSGETVAVATMTVDEHASENRDARPRPDDGEFIEAVAVPRADLAAFYRRETERGTGFDAKAFAYILALTQGDGHENRG